MILPPQNPEGPGERGEAVQIKDPDPDTKAKIGTTFSICFHYEHFHIIKQAFSFIKFAVKKFVIELMHIIVIKIH